MQRLLIILSFFTLSFSEALLDFSDYNDFSKTKRSQDSFLGFTPYVPIGFMGQVRDINSFLSIDLSGFKTEQRNVRFHWGTTFLIFSGIGLHVKQYWLETRYEPISIFSAFSLSANMILPMCSSDDCDPVVFDTQIFSSGLDFNILRFNKFDLRLAAGLMAGYSIALKEVNAAPFLNATLSY